MKYIFGILFYCISFPVFAQVESLEQDKDSVRTSLRDSIKENPKAPIAWYKIFTISRDTTVVDTSLTIKKDYKFNYLRKDTFGWLPFANDGQGYTVLDFGSKKNNAFPEFNFTTKKQNYLDAQEVSYYSVPTPLTELYFKTVLEQGQSVDAFLAVNTSKNFNIAIGYKGIRSIGKYINSLTSNGRLTLSSNYHTTNNRYRINWHYVAHDLYNQENGGLLKPEDFSSENPQFSQRSRLDVLLEDANSMFKSKRFFVNHAFRLNNGETSSAILFEHEFKYEHQSYEFKKTTETDYFGTAYKTANYDDQTQSKLLFNSVGATFSNTTVGNFKVFVSDYQNNYFYTRYTLSNNLVSIPSELNLHLNAFGGTYYYSKNKINGSATFSKGISKQAFSTLELAAKFTLNEKNYFQASYQNVSKIPDLNYQFYQSDFVHYNWFNSFENEKINQLKVAAHTQWGSAEGQVQLLTDHLYFAKDDPASDALLLSPKQYGGTIKYVSLKLDKEFKFWKLALDNTVLYQQVAQSENILNVPKIVTRNTFYYSDYVFKKALFLQTGFTFQYFSSYNADGYNPLMANFYTQTQTQIGGYPMIDFFVNGRVRQTRIFLKAEHFNSGFTGNNFFVAPNYPYKDFIIRFGLVWNFFQ